MSIRRRNNGYTQVFTGAEPTNSLSQTTRLNYDQTITPTLLMHVGAGLLQTTLYTMPAADLQPKPTVRKQHFYLPYFPSLRRRIHVT